MRRKWLSPPGAVFLLSVHLVAPCTPLLGQADSSTSEAALAILTNKCVACHGLAQMSGLDVRERDSLLRGGKRGPAVVPGVPEDSLLFLASAHQGDLKMPPASGSPLPVSELDILEKWIHEGVVWPDTGGMAGGAEPSWWSFKKLRRPPLPTPDNLQLVANPIDAFVVAKLEAKGLKPAPRADKRTLIRRVYFDLIGLPPTPDEVNGFLNNPSPDSYKELIEELLASPRYGERWARHWLDVARYADSGGFEVDAYLPNAWRYRDYVIKSFNEDKPYDRFVQEQIAGDELWPDNLDLDGFYDVPLEKLEHLEARIGTALYTLAPEISESRLDATRLRYEWLTDCVDTTGAAFMGVTMGCARCHDHKFDPISQRDYFRLQAVFAASEMVEVPVVTGMSSIHREEAYHLLIALDEARIAYRAFEEKIKDRLVEAKKKESPPEVVSAFEIPQKDRTAEQAELAAPLTKFYTEIKIAEHLSSEDQSVYERLIQRLADAVLAVPEKDGSHGVRFQGFFDLPSATVLGNKAPELIPETYVFDRGDLGREKEKVKPGLPRGLAGESDGKSFQPESVGIGPRYRKRLALWLTRPGHPLTARVMVNRIWQGHFGNGIAGTPEDLGHQGSQPTHPELLDWLAAEFVQRGWSVKSMHRLILLSNTYQRQSRFLNGNNSQIDPENRFLWRTNRRRLEAEAVWDSIHAVAGTLNLKMGGRAVTPPLSDTELAGLRHKPVWVEPGDAAEANRRAIYILVKRNFRFPMFDKFDAPDPALSCARRDVTTVAPQALWTLNNQVSFDQAQHFAARLVDEIGEDPSAWIDQAWRIALARLPTEQEKQEARSLLKTLSLQNTGETPVGSLPGELGKLDNARARALSQLCLTILNLSEFSYID